MRRPSGVIAPAFTAPSRSSSSSPACQAAAGGGSYQRRSCRRPAPCSSSATPARSARAISGSSNGAARVVIVLRVEPHDAAGARATRATRALRAARAADTGSISRLGTPLHGECRAMRASPLSITARHAVDRHARLGDVRREDHLAAPPDAGRTARPARRPAGRRAAARPRGRSRARHPRGPRRAPDLAGAGQEHEHVAVEAFLRDAPHRRRRPACRAVGHRAAAACSIVDRERAAFASARSARRRGTPRPARHRASPTSRRASARARCARRRSTIASARSPSRWRSWNSSMITQPTPRSSGSPSSRRVSTPSVTKLDPRRRRRRACRTAPRSRPRRRARRRAPSRSASPRAAPRGAAAASTTISPLPRVEQRTRHARRLAGAGRRDQHADPALAHRRDDRGQHGVDG